MTLFITDLPDEIICLILCHINDPFFSACVGLTCRRFYAIHWELFGPVKKLHPPFSYAYLREWMGDTYEWNRRTGLFRKKGTGEESFGNIYQLNHTTRRFVDMSIEEDWSTKFHVAPTEKRPRKKSCRIS